MEPHYVWATDANTRQRIPVNLSAIPTWLPVQLPDGRAVTALFLGGMTTTPNGGFAYAQVQVLETIEDLITAPRIKLGKASNRGSKKKELPPEIAKLAKPHKAA